jgi:hypothetical protein
VSNLLQALLARLETWHPFFNRARNQPGRTSRKSAYRPQLEWLEDRWVPSATASISGHVFVDQTGNGLSTDDVAQRHVVVELFADTNHNGVLDRRDRLVDARVTGVNGSYAFTHLKAGTYFVIERVPNDYVRTGPAVLADYTVQLAKGQKVTGQDFDNFQKVHTNAVRDVTFTITHGSTTTTVTDLRGNTHAGDTVVVNFTIAHGARPTVVSLVTYDASTANQLALVGDATGTFGPGQHSLTIQVPTSDYQIDFVAGAAIDHFGPTGSNVSYSAEKRLISADTGAAPVVQANASLSGVVYVDNNSNSMLDAGDTGNAGVLVTLTGTDYLGHSVNATFMTDSTGAYSFTGLLPGTYRIDVSTPFNMMAETANAGTLGGTPGAASTINIVVTNGAAGTGYNFAELPGGNPNS